MKNLRTQKAELRQGMLNINQFNTELIKKNDILFDGSQVVSINVFKGKVIINARKNNHQVVFIGENIFLNNQNINYIQF
jgi:hypothetical protein